VKADGAKGVRVVKPSQSGQDNLGHDLMMRAVKKHAKEKWVVLYIERWLKAPAQDEQGNLTMRERGTPQGGVITPRTQSITSNLSGS